MPDRICEKTRVAEAGNKYPIRREIVSFLCAAAVAAAAVLPPLSRRRAIRNRKFIFL